MDGVEIPKIQGCPDSRIWSCELLDICVLAGPSALQSAVAIEAKTYCLDCDHCPGINKNS